MTMRVRKVDNSGDMTFGSSRSDFWQNAPEGVGQVVASRLHMEEGEWFLDVTDGTPWSTEVLGKRTEATRDAAIRLRVLDTPDVLEISEYDSVLDRDARGFSINLTIQTNYGPAEISEPF